MNIEFKKKLQAEIIWASTRSGAFQRARLYKPTAHKEKKEQFKIALKEFLYKHIFLKYYNSSITEKKLKGLIAQIIKIQKGNSILRGKEFRYGNAQKFINLYLKGMWVSGYLKVPPHFPIDSIMLNKLKKKHGYTGMNEKQYDATIETAKELLKSTTFKTIAEWEADAYQKEYIDKR